MGGNCGKKRLLEYASVSAAAYLPLLALPYAMKIDLYGISNSVFSIPIYIGVWLLLWNTKKIMEKRLLCASLFAGVLFAGTLVVGTSIYNYAEGQSTLYILCMILLLSVLFVPLVMHVIHYMPLWLKTVTECGPERKLRLFFINREKRVALAGWGVIFGVWMIGLLATFPGIYAYDAVFQMQQLLQGQLHAHHPVLHTLLMGGCFFAGNRLFGSYEMGMFLYSVLQMAFMAFVFVRIARKVAEESSALVSLLMVFGFALIPYHMLFSMSSTKDVIFAGLFALTALKFYDIVRFPEAFFHSKWQMAQYVILTFLMCAFRNNGIYAFCCTVPVFFICYRREWKRVLVLTLAVFCVWGIYKGPVHRALKVEPGGAQEALSVPIVQLARAMIYNRELLSEEEADLIETYIPLYKNYTPRVSDPVKDTFHTERFEENKLEFIKLWVGVGLKCPRTYLEAFLSLNLGYWYPDMIYEDPGAYHPYIEYRNTEYGAIGEGAVYIERTSLIPALEKALYVFAYGKVYQRFPVLSMLFVPGFYFWLIVLGIFVCIYYRRLDMALPFSLMAGLWATLILSPLVLLRYAYPLIVSSPLVLCMMYRAAGTPYMEDEGKEKSDG